MARVPTYNGRQVAPDALPNVRITDRPAQDMRAGAQAIAQGVGAMADVGAQWAMQEQEKANDAAMMGYKNALSAIESDLLNNPETGAYGTQGKQAFDVRERTLPQWDKRQSEALASLPGHLQSRARLLADDKRIQIDNGLMRHTLQESTRYRDEQAAAMVQNAQQAAVLNWEDEERVGEELANIDAAIAMRMRGASGEAVSMEQARAKSGAVLGIFSRHMERDPWEANAWLKKHGDLMTADDLMKAESALQPMFRERAVASMADDWMADDSGQTAVGFMPVQGAASSESEVRQVAARSVARTIGLESGGKANAKNPNSSATGLGQFTSDTWVGVIRRNRPDLVRGKTRAQILALRTDPAISREMTEAFAVENGMALYRSGLPVTEQTLYWAHHFGATGARRILTSPPDTPIQKLLTPAEYAANPYLKDKATGRSKTIGEVLANHQKRAGEAVPPATMQTGIAPMRTADGKPDWVALKERANQLQNPHMRDAMLRELGRRQGLSNERERQDTEAFSERVYNAINRATGSESLLQLLGPVDYARLEREGGVAKAENALRGNLQRSLTQSDIVLVDALDREAVLSPDTFAKRDLHALVDRLNTSDMARLIGMRDKLRDPKTRDQAIADWTTEQARLDGAMADLGIAAVPGQSKQAKNANKKTESQRAAFNYQYRLALQSFIQQNGGKKPTPDQADALVREVKLRFHDGRVTYDQASKLQQFSSGLPLDGVQLSQQDRATVVAVLRSRGNKNPTEAQVLATASAYKSNQR